MVNQFKDILGMFGKIGGMPTGNPLLTGANIAATRSPLEILGALPSVGGVGKAIKSAGAITKHPLTKSTINNVTNNFKNTTPGNTIIRNYGEFQGKTMPDVGQVRPNINSVGAIPRNNTSAIYRNTPIPSPANGQGLQVRTGDTLTSMPQQSPVGKPTGYYNSTNPSDTIIRSYPEFQGQTQPNQQMIDQAGQIRSNMNVTPTQGNNPNTMYGNNFNTVPSPQNAGSAGINNAPGMQNIGDNAIQRTMPAPYAQVDNVAQPGTQLPMSMPQGQPGVFDTGSGFGSEVNLGAIGNNIGMEAIMGGMNSPIGSFGNIGGSMQLQQIDPNQGGGGFQGY
jgi:hypothetical protein